MLAWSADFASLPAAFAQDAKWEQYLDSSEQALRDGQPDVAAKLFQSALAETEKLPLGDPRLERTLKAYADFDYEYGHYQDAFDLYKRLLKSKRSHLTQELSNSGGNSGDTSASAPSIPDKDIGTKAVFDQPSETATSSTDDAIATANVLISLGDCSDSLHNGQATHYFEEARALLEKHLPANDPKIADVLVDLGGSEADNQDYWIAEGRFKNAVAIYENNYQASKNIHVRRKLVGALEQLANVLVLNNKNTEAKKVQDRIIALNGVPDIRPQEPTDIISR
jgi:tetratricopeptide (TPR) repeat protein